MVYRIDETTMAKSIAVLSLISLTDSDLIIAVTTRDFYTNSLRHIIQLDRIREDRQVHRRLW